MIPVGMGARIGVGALQFGVENWCKGSIGSKQV